MRKRALTVAVALAALWMTRPALAQMVKGQVVKVDEAAGKITIKHGPIKKFDMDDGMTMAWRARDPAMLKQGKAGDRVKFEAERVNGQFTVTRIEKTK